tara:strand:- start:400 stop:837 length:438 start_codon:yes stop_codon:yes gene_type:complete
MKKSDLIEVIRRVVRKEVKAALKEELGKKQPSSNGEFGQMMEHAEELFNEKKFAKNPILNEALNQTAAKKEAWPTMGGKPFTDGRSGLARAMGMSSPDEMFGGKPTAQQMVPEDRKHVKIDKDLEGILTRDYRDLMKHPKMQGKK